LALSLGIGALQLMLDRGQTKDWFHSSEIWIEATVAGLGFYLFAVHTVTTDERSFLNRDLRSAGSHRRIGSAPFEAIAPIRRGYSEVESCCKHSLIIWTTAWGPAVPTTFAIPCSVTVRM